MIIRIQPIRSGNIAENHLLKLVELFSGQTRFSSEFSGKLYNIFLFDFFSGLLD